MTAQDQADAQRRRVRRLFSMRARLNAAVAEEAGVIGSMVGRKVSGGIVTDKVGVTYLVEEKVPDSDLSPSARIPSQVVVGRTPVATDVLVWPKMAQQSLSDARLLFDQATQGSLTCFGRSPFGLFGVSCAHSLIGPDRNPATPTGIDMYSRSLRRLVPAGTSSVTVAAPGQGTGANFGYADCGLFVLDEPSLEARAARAAPLAFVQDARDLVHATLYATSGLNAPGYPDHRRTGHVIGVYKQAFSEAADIVIQADAPGTFHGDSGMLWRTADGRAAAIHARGEVRPDGSLLTTAMLASRAARLLSIELLDG